MIKCKLLGIDLDGTLLSTFKRISRTDMKSLKEYQTLGGNFVLCTGRSINSTFNYSRLIDNKMNTVQKFIIACCGSYIMNLANSTVKEYFIPDALVRKIHNYILTTNGKIAL
jgi:hydroxymethylpyrimidine pyrophosphatase-like HAD family hydrolase